MYCDNIARMENKIKWIRMKSASGRSRGEKKQ